MIPLDFLTKVFLSHLHTDHWGDLPSAPGKSTVQEFDYKAENEVIYEQNGVNIRSWPAIHAGDGAVRFALEYNGLKVVIGGDSMPNT
jgi:ribonuclease Z